MNLTLGKIADWIHAEGDFDDAAVAVGYSIDSRTIGAGELFFAVRGERLDGHDFVETALANGAVGAVVSMRWLQPAQVDAGRLLRVPDGPQEDGDSDGVLLSLQQLARQVRRGWGGRVIGVTGSAGKTTTKDAVAQVLGARNPHAVLKSQGNLNNGFGLPLQLLRLEARHQAAVIEMGMNHAGEIAALARIAEPDWAVVTNVAPVHLEHFADGIEGIARAKYELVEALPADGIAFLNVDDEYVTKFGNSLGERAVYYGLGERAEVRGVELIDAHDGVQFTAIAAGHRERVKLQLLGRHNVLNALAAIAVGLRSAISLAECAAAAAALQPGDRRGERIEWRGATVINDSYNSNPHALDAMVDALIAMPVGQGGRRIVVAGEMLELGAEGGALHAACGRRMAERGVGIVVGVRGLASGLVDAASRAGAHAIFLATPEDAGAWLRENARTGDVILLKASRGVKLERALVSLVD
jgi:UDP-N-acetylmuramoyl-tripeptide--D-alanyl-D-alanine ligase